MNMKEHKAHLAKSQLTEDRSKLPAASSCVFFRWSRANCKSRLSWICFCSRSANLAPNSQDFCINTTKQDYKTTFESKHSTAVLGTTPSGCTEHAPTGFTQPRSVRHEQKKNPTTRKF